MDEESLSVSPQTVRDWFQKINVELDELKESILIAYFGMNVLIDMPIFEPGRNDLQDVAKKANEVITTVTSMLNAMGIDNSIYRERQGH